MLTYSSWRHNDTGNNVIKMRVTAKKLNFPSQLKKMQCYFYRKDEFLSLIHAIQGRTGTYPTNLTFISQWITTMSILIALRIVVRMESDHNVNSICIPTLIYGHILQQQVLFFYNSQLIYNIKCLVFIKKNIKFI